MDVPIWIGGKGFSYIAIFFNPVYIKVQPLLFVLFPHTSVTAVKLFDTAVLLALYKTVVLIVSEERFLRSTIRTNMRPTQYKNHTTYICGGIRIEQLVREQMLAKAFASRISLRKNLSVQLTAFDILKGYQWSDELKTAVQEEIVSYRKEIVPYLKYNPDKIGSDIERIGEYLEEIGSKAEAVGDKAPAVILDYLHMVTTTQKVDNAELIKQLVKMLKDYAINYNTFVLAILATNRASNGKITLDSGRDSSNLEYSGDYVLSLEYKSIDDGTVQKTFSSYNDDLAKLQQENPRKMIMRVLKHRLGGVGKSIYLNFNPVSGYFYPDTEVNETTVGSHKNIPVK